MKTLSRKDIEAIASRVCEAYRKLPDLQGKPIYKIEPEKLVTDVLGLDIEFHHLSATAVFLALHRPVKSRTGSMTMQIRNTTPCLTETPSSWKRI